LSMIGDIEWPIGSPKTAKSFFTLFLPHFPVYLD
jgi:hypothetical protein